MKRVNAFKTFESAKNHCPYGHVVVRVITSDMPYRVCTFDYYLSHYHSHFYATLLFRNKNF